VPQLTGKKRVSSVELRLSLRQLRLSLGKPRFLLSQQSIPLCDFFLIGCQDLSSIDLDV
jgi:hypothetical protein